MGNKERIFSVIGKLLLGLATFIVGALALGITATLLFSLMTTTGKIGGKTAGNTVDVAIMDRYDMYMTNKVSDALDGILSVDKVYWLSDFDQVAPEPNPECYGSSNDPSTLGWLLEAAEDILDGQDTLFNTETELIRGTEVRYYLDETIFAVTWKQAVNDSTFTISEVKIKHPSQFRRFLSGGAYGSGIQLKTTEMAASVNAVVASAGDFYGFRSFGTLVYNGEIKRVNNELVDTCYIDDKGDLHFSYRGEYDSMEAAQEFVDKNNIRFSVAFGPALIEHGKPIQLTDYYIGEIWDQYDRSALCQMGELHYMVVVCNQEDPHYGLPVNLEEFQQRLVEFGCEMAYTLDGGQTATIVMNDKLINRVVYNAERDITDIIYFATAIPNGE